MAAIDKKSHMTWRIASSGARRVTKVMPIPDSKNTTGNIAESAAGAKNLIARCAIAKAAARPIGTASVLNEMSAPVFITYIA